MGNWRLHFFLKWYSYQVDRVRRKFEIARCQSGLGRGTLGQVASLCVTFLKYVPFRRCMRRQYRVFKYFEMCSGGSMESSLEAYPFQLTTFFRHGPDPMCRTMQLTVYSDSSVVRLFERFRSLGGDVGTSKVEFPYGVRLWCRCDKGVDASIAGT